MARPSVGDLIALGSGGYSLTASDFEVAAIGSNYVDLIWSDPADVIVDGSPVAEWGGTKLLRKTGSYPATDQEGTVVADIKTRNQHKTTPYKDSGLTQGVNYYYMLFAYTSSGVIAIDPKCRVSATPLTAEELLLAEVVAIIGDGVVGAANESLVQIVQRVLGGNYTVVMLGQGSQHNYEDLKITKGSVYIEITASYESVEAGWLIKLVL